MPANLTPQYLEAEQRYKRATTPEQKLEALEDMFALIPKHKGTEKLQADIKKKISQSRVESQQRKGPRRQDLSNIPREGAGRVVLAGPPNSGKSALLKIMTNAEPEIAPWAFTTREPELGMAPYEDIQFQIIDLPAVNRQHMEPWLMNLVRSAELLFLVVDQSSPGVLEEIEELEQILAEYKIYHRERSGDPDRGAVVIPAVLVVNKMDLPGSEDNAAVVRELFDHRFEIHPVSAESGTGVEPLKRSIFEKLGIIRVYTKLPGKPPDLGRPYVLHAGDTILDLCQQVHHDFVDTLKFARVWGKSTFEGQRVNRDYNLQDGDVVELHR